MRLVARRQQPLLCDLTQSAVRDATQLLTKVKGLEDTIVSVIGGGGAASDAGWATESVRHTIHELLEVQQAVCGS